MGPKFVFYSNRPCLFRFYFPYFPISIGMYCAFFRTTRHFFAAKSLLLPVSNPGKDYFFNLRGYESFLKGNYKINLSPIIFFNELVETFPCNYC